MEQSRALSPNSGLNLPEMARLSQEILRCGTSPQEALAQAEKLVGCWPHARPPDPKTYSAALSATLAGYPLGVVQECCDPRTGLARDREFPPTVAAIVAWCDSRLTFHQKIAAWKPMIRRPAEPNYPDDHCAAMRERIAEIPAKYFTLQSMSGEGADA